MLNVKQKLILYIDYVYRDYFLTWVDDLKNEWKILRRLNILCKGNKWKYCSPDFLYFLQSVFNHSLISLYVMTKNMVKKYWRLNLLWYPVPVLQ